MNLMTNISLTRAAGKFSKKIRNRFTGNGIINYRGKGTINFIDVGSSGNMPEPWASNARHIKNLLSFEPQDKARKRKNVIVSSSALWSENCSRTFFIYKGFKSSGSSLFEQNFDYVNEHFETLKKSGPSFLAETWYERSQLMKTEVIECKTLDSIIDEHNLPFNFDFIKIDAQGAEYEILMGAEKFLSGSCSGLQLELFNIPLYKNIKLLPEVTEFLDQKGFDLVKKLPYHGSFDSQNDCIFLRKEPVPGRESVFELLRKLYKL